MAGEAGLQQLLDKQAIREATLRYCRGVDRCDPELIASAFHPDAVESHGGYHGDIPGFLEWLLPKLRANHYVTTHLIANQLIELELDVAFSEAYLVAFHRSLLEGADVEWVFGGRYVDRFERRGGDWRIASRVLVHDWSRTGTVDPQAWAPPLSFAAGLRSREDPSYER
jgi:hypothetical protein